MKILVTGGTGVIGAAALPALLRAGHELRLLSRHANRDARAFPAEVEPFVADIGAGEGLDAAVAGCDAILHIAGIAEETPPDSTFERINVGGTAALCAAAAARPAQPFLVFISSLGADTGASPYHQSKLRAEEHVRAYPGSWLILRPGNVYGPGDETISMLLKMTRTMPVVPVVGDADQPFQPMWYEDFGAAIARALAQPELAGQTLELAGVETTTTDDVLTRLATITGRNPTRLPVPAWLAQIGTAALESLGGAAKKLLADGGMQPPLNSTKLQLLLEGSVIRDPAKNALVTVFDVTPTSLDDGLAQLADLLPEQTPGEGVGGVERSIYSAEIQGTPLTADELIARVSDNIADVMPLEFAAEPGVPTSAEEGATLTAAIPGRGNIQVRTAERTDTHVTLVTVEGHPLAGVVKLAAGAIPGGVRFSIEIVAQPANAFDWIAMRTVGGAMQRRNWRAVVRRVVELSGGRAPAGVQRQAEMLDPAEVRTFNERIRALLAERQRTEVERKLNVESR